MDSIGCRFVRDKRDRKNCFISKIIVEIVGVVKTVDKSRKPCGTSIFRENFPQKTVKKYEVFCGWIVENPSANEKKFAFNFLDENLNLPVEKSREACRTWVSRKNDLWKTCQSLSPISFSRFSISSANAGSVSIFFWISW